MIPDSSDILPLDPLEPVKVDRESLILLRRAIGEGWNVPANVLANGGAVALRILADANASNRDKLRALDLINKMRDSNIAAAVALDKVERLDGGGATEIVYQVNKIEL